MLRSVVNSLLAIFSTTKFPRSRSLRRPATSIPPAGKASLTAMSRRSGVSGPIWALGVMASSSVERGTFAPPIKHIRSAPPGRCEPLVPLDKEGAGRELLFRSRGNLEIGNSGALGFARQLSPLSERAVNSNQRAGSRKCIINKTKPARVSKTLQEVTTLSKKQQHQHSQHCHKLTTQPRRQPPLPALASNAEALGRGGEQQAFRYLGLLGGGLDDRAGLS
jgi:hypothetical protein